MEIYKTGTAPPYDIVTPAELQELYNQDEYNIIRLDYEKDFLVFILLYSGNGSMCVVRIPSPRFINFHLSSGGMIADNHFK